MNDERDELETRLRDGFRSGSLPAAPARLLDALERIPEAPVTRGSSARSAGAGEGRVRGGRMPWGALGVAAVLLLGGAVALSVGGRGPVPQPSPKASTHAAPSQVAGDIRITYEPDWTADVPKSADTLAAAAMVVQKRIDSTGIFGARVGVADGTWIVVDVPRGTALDPIRRLLGQTGRLEFIPILGEAPVRGAVLDPSSHPAPLFDNSGIANVKVGQPDLTFILEPDAAAAFGTYTAASIGRPFAIVLDGTVLAAPIIREAIPGGDIQITFPTGAIDDIELATLATIVKWGPLPVALREVALGPIPSGSVADPVIRCEAPVPVAGLQLQCQRAVQAALAALPDGHPAVREVTFNHGCPSIPGALIDCATQMFGIVEISFVDGSPPVRILVDFDLKTTILPGFPSQDPGATPLGLNPNNSDLGCDTVRMQYRSVVIGVDASAAEQVTAVTNLGDTLRTFWSSSFRGGTSSDPVVYDHNGFVVARDGTRIDLPDAAFPTLAGYFVCPSDDAIYVFDQPPS